MRTTINQLALTIACGAALAIAGPSQAAPGPKTADDGRDQLSGTWKLDSFEFDGERCALVLGTHTVELDIKRGTYRMDLSIAFAGWEKHRGRIKVIGFEKGVYQVDLEYTATGSVGESNKTAESRHMMKAIFELVDKDNLRVCRTQGKDRPDRFETRKGDGWTVEVFKRKKP